MSMTQADFSTLAKLQHRGSPLGRTFYVDSAHTKASANAAGTPDVPFNSIANALARLATTTNTAVASSSNATGVVGTLRGDVILVAPSHTETISAAATTWSRSNVAIIGLSGSGGTGQNRPTIQFTTSTAAQLIVSGDKVTIENFHINAAGIAAVVLAISVTGTDFTLRNNNIILGAGTSDGAVRFIDLTGTASRATIEGNFFTSTAGATNITSAIRLSGTSQTTIIRNNDFMAAASATAGAFIEGTGAALRILVYNNNINLQHTQVTNSTARVAVFHASSTGMFCRNYVTFNDTAASGGGPTIITTTLLSYGNNYVSKTPGSLATLT